MGHEVLAMVDSGEAALQAVRLGLPDIILMDIKIEGPIDGIETVIEIKKIAEIPVIYTSGNSDPSTLKRAQDSGCEAFLVKPIIETELKNEIDKVLAKTKPNI